MMDNSNIILYYFGSADDSGHVIHGPNRGYVSKKEKNSMPFKEVELDAGKFLPKDLFQTQSECKLNHYKNWTLLSFWDRTGDGRGNSNSTFFCKGIFDFEFMISLIQKEYSILFERIQKIKPLYLGTKS